MKSPINSTLAGAASVSLVLGVASADYAHATSIQTFIDTRVTNVSTGTAAEDAPAYTVNTVPQLLTPTTYPTSTSSLSGGTSTANATVSLGTLHADQTSSFPVAGSPTGYSTGYVNIIVNETGIAGSSLLMIPSFSLTGSNSVSDVHGDSFSSLLFIYTVIDHTTGAQSQIEINTANPSQNHTATVLTPAAGDSIELGIVFDITSYQDNLAGISPAFADYSNTLHFYLNDFISSSGFDFAPPAASGTPLPAALPMFGGGLATLALLGRRRKQKAAA